MMSDRKFVIYDPPHHSPLIFAGTARAAYATYALAPTPPLRAYALYGYSLIG